MLVMDSEEADILRRMDKIILDYENMNEMMQETAQSQNLDIYQEYVLAKEWKAKHDKHYRQLGVIVGTRKALTMLILLSLLARYGRTMFV